MTKEIWINLPVKDVKKSKAFFTKIGFSFNEQQTTDQSACMLVGAKNTIVMLFAESMFNGFIGGAPVADAKQANEVLFSFDAESRQEVDELAKKVTDTGGTLYGKPGEIQGWMYGFGFVDPDGHKWNALHMDFSKMPK
jgi:predicted lactoylglutathione lyase